MSQACKQDEQLAKTVTVPVGGSKPAAQEKPNFNAEQVRHKVRMEPQTCCAGKGAFQLRDDAGWVNLEDMLQTCEQEKPPSNKFPLIVGSLGNALQTCRAGKAAFQLVAERGSYAFGT